MMRKKLGMLLVTGLSAVVMAAPLSAAKLHTGKETGAYFNDIGPAVKAYLDNQLFRLEMVMSPGSTANLRLVAENIGDVGLSRADTYAIYNAENPGVVVAVPTGIKSCLYAVTKSPAILGDDPAVAWGNMLRLAPRMKIGLPGETSGATTTFRFISKNDQSLQRVRDGNVVNYEKADLAIEAAASGEMDIAFFVQFPDPTNKRFQLIDEKGLTIVGVGSRAMSRLTVPSPDGGAAQSVYQVQNVPVQETLGGWGSDKTVSTMCTEIVIVTRSADDLEGDAKMDQKDLIQVLSEAPLGSFEPQASWFAGVKKYMAPMTDAASTKFLDAIEATKDLAQ